MPDTGERGDHRSDLLPFPISNRRNLVASRDSRCTPYEHATMQMLTADQGRVHSFYVKVRPDWAVLVVRVRLACLDQHGYEHLCLWHQVGSSTLSMSLGLRLVRT